MLWALTRSGFICRPRGGARARPTWRRLLMEDAWWGPTTVVPGESRARMLVIEKSLPGSILVNGRGERFVNEAAPYIDIVNAMYEKHSPDAPSVPCYLVFDARYRKNYPCGPFLQGSQQPDWALPRALKRARVARCSGRNSLGSVSITQKEPTTVSPIRRGIPRYERIE